MKNRFFTFCVMLICSMQLYAYTINYYPKKEYVQNDCKFAVWYWNSSGTSRWSSWMSSVNGVDGWFSVNIPNGYDNLLFVTFNNSVTSPAWGSEIYQSSDLVHDPNNTYYVEGSGWGNSYRIILSHIYINGLYYNLDTEAQTATVTYQSYKTSNNYSSHVNLTIPSFVLYDGKTYTVTTIGEYAFYECLNLRSVTLPQTITSIGFQAFVTCNNLTDISFPETSLTYIGNYAFAGCYFTSLNIPNSVETIGLRAFQNCFNLRSIYIGKGVKGIGEYVFYNSSNINSVTCAAMTPPSLGSGVFDGINTSNIHLYIPCGTLDAYQSSNWGSQFSKFVEDCVEGQQIYYTSTDSNIVTPYATDVFGANIVSNTYENGVGTITFDGPVTSIGRHAFNNCSSLSSIVIPNTVEKIGVCAFYGSSIISLDIPNSVTSLGDWAFADTPIESIAIPNSVTHIGVALLTACNSLTSIVVEEGNSNYDSRDNCNAIIEKSTNRLIATCPNTIIPNTVTTIATRAFQNSAIPSIDIPNSVVRIEAYAFRWATQLNSITIPNSVNYIGDSVFYSCPLDTIRMEAMTPPTIGVNPFSSLPVCVIPCGTLAAYKSSAWASQMGRFEEDCVEGQQIFYNSTDGKIVTPNDVNVFGANIVSNTYENGVGTITFDGPVTSIGGYAFDGCSNLFSITIPNSITNIGRAAFQECSSLTSITIPNSVTSIGDFAFGGCSSLTSITIPNSVISIGERAFVRCYSLTAITIPNSVTNIGESAFTWCSSLDFIIVEEGNAIFDSRNNCNAIIETITNTLVQGCSGTTIPNSVINIGDRAFAHCNIISIIIPKNVMSIGYAAFGWCENLETVHIESTTPPILDSTWTFSPYPICYIPCGSLAAYEASAWATQVSEFIEEGCPTFQMCGDNLYWEYADGVLTITGTGDMYDYAADADVPWYDVRGNIKTVSLPDAMTKIGQNAFYKCTVMTSINMPTSLTAIGEKAFAQDTKLACEIILPASMTNIASRAFFNCKAVPAFHVEATTPPTVQADAFDYTTAPIHVPCGYGHIYGKHTQWGMLNLEMCELLQDNVYYYPIDGHTARAVTYHSNPTDTIVIPSAVVIDGMPRTVTEVADFAFTDCKDIPAIIFNEGLEYIGERAFVRCYGLQGTIVLPATLETIGERAFSYCNNVDRYTIQAMTPPVLGANAFTGDNKNALFYISCEAMDDYKVATNWSSLKSRLRDACLNIYHYNTALGANGVHTTEDTLVASIYYRRQFTTSRWETLYLPFEVDRVTVLEDGVEYDLNAWSIFTGGHYYLAKPYGIENKEVVFGFTQVVDAHTPYIIQFKEPYYHDKMITFHGKESWNKLSTSFEALPISFEMQMAGNTTLQDQILEEPVYMLRASSNFILQNTTTTLHPFECYVMPYTAQSGAPARMNVRLRDDVATAVESVKGNESRLAYTINDHTLTVYPQGQAFSIYSLNGALIYSCEAGKEAVDCDLNSGCYLLHAGTEAHKIML